MTIFYFIDKQYNRAINILTENRDKLDALAQKLLDKEVIFREDLEEIFGKRAWDPELTEKPVTQTVEAETPKTEEKISEENPQEAQN